MSGRLVARVVAASAVAALCASPARAQERAPAWHKPPPLLALAANDLSFGTVLPGIPSSVSVRDPHHAGVFEVHGPAGASVRIEFILPAALTSERGALLPIAFGAGDGFADFSRGHQKKRGLVFDPHAPLIGALGPNGRLFVSLGGTVLPARVQPAGRYRATISMTVYSLGS
jgi:hypothetical protein